MLRIPKVMHLCILLWAIYGTIFVDARRLPTSYRASPAADKEPVRRTLSENNESKRRSLVTSPEEHLVESLPGLPDGTFKQKQYAGTMPVTGGELFYWLFESAASPATDPLVIWLNGGPGCSSMDGLFLENGPFKVDWQGNLTLNPHSWHTLANMLYVDQPLGTGMSYVNTGDGAYANNEADVDARFYEFLQSFLKVHTTYVDRPIWFTGESHAGHYIPSMLAYIQKQNARVRAGTGSITLNVKGAAIGNGWTDPYNQYDVSEFAFGHGLIDEQQMRSLKESEAVCQGKLKAGVYMSNVCFDLLSQVIDASGPGGKQACMYDIRKYGVAFPPGKEMVEKYLNRADVRKAIHDTNDPDQYVECANPPYDHLSQWDGVGVTKEVASVLEGGLQLLFFNGQYDLICNHVGNEKWLTMLEWSGAQAYREAHRSSWIVDGAVAGYIKTSGNGLGFLLVLGAGHMVPLDVPVQALDILKRVITGASFATSDQGIPEVYGPWLGLGGSCDAQQTTAGTVAPPPAPLPAPVIQEPVLVTRTQAQVNFTPGTGTPESSVEYSVTATPGGASASGPQSPLTVNGLAPGVSYVFKVTAKGSQPDGGATTWLDAVSSESLPVTPGCSEGFESNACGEYGVCAPIYFGANVASCLCRNGYTGDRCSAPATNDTQAPCVLPDQVPGNSTSTNPPLGKGVVYEGSHFSNSNVLCPEREQCTYLIEVEMSKDAFPTQSFYKAVQQPMSTGSIATMDALTYAQAWGFYSLISSDVAVALNVDVDLVQVKSITGMPAGGVEAVLVIDSIDGGVVSAFTTQWVVTTSALHQGIFTRYINFLAGATITLGTEADIIQQGGGTPPPPYQMPPQNPIIKGVLLGGCTAAVMLVVIWVVSKRRSSRRPVTSASNGYVRTATF